MSSVAEEGREGPRCDCCQRPAVVWVRAGIYSGPCCEAQKAKVEAWANERRLRVDVSPITGR